MRIVRYLTLIGVLILIAGATILTYAPHESVTVTNLWVRPALEGGNTAVYFEVTNNTDQFISLINVQTDLAALSQIHQTVVENDMARMQHIENGVRIGSGETLHFEPGGYHVMLMNVVHTINEGEAVSVELIFDNDERLSVMAQVTNVEPVDSK
jgi:copper(I)-binding protein